MRRTQNKGYYLCNFNPFDENHILTGVDKKVMSQINVFRKHGIDCDFIYCPYASSKLRRGLGSLPLLPDGIQWPDVKRVEDATFLYIRRPLYASREFNNFLKAFKENNKNSLIIIELPTFPYDKEYAGLEMSFALKKDRKYRNQWHNFVDYIADLSGQDEIFHTPVLPIINGIDLSKVSPRNPSLKEDREINIIFSAFFAPWHGCDLLLQGLADYYSSGGCRKITLHLAGGGNLIDEITQMIHILKLESHVVLHGALSSDQLDELFDQCTFAVGSLGLHRRDATCRDSSLKTREYLAKGIPFIYAGSVDVFEEDPVDFCLQIPSQEAPIDFCKLIEFHDNLYQSKSEKKLIYRIRSYAENHVSMDRAMGSVLDAILNKK